MMTNPHHLEIIKLLQAQAGSPPKTGLFMVHYCGSDKPGYDLNTAAHTSIIRQFTQKHPLTVSEYLDLITSLYQKGRTFNEIIVAGNLVGHLLKITDFQFNPKILDTWLNYVHGWAEADVLCQSNFTADIILNNWSSWSHSLKHLSASPEIHHRRASLVLLTKSLRQSNDPRLSKIAFDLVEKLKTEKDILITKAISWILRSLVTHHSQELKAYLDSNQSFLPKIAYREAMNKLVTGRKNGKL